MPRRINHNRRILSERVVSLYELLPGQIIRFRYNAVKRYDPNPLVLFLYNDQSKNLIHGINLNYLYELDVQRAFTQISSIVNVGMENNKNNDFIKVQLTKGNVKTGVGAEKLYEQFIKPKLFNVGRTKDCYRTYKNNKITTLKLVNYRMDVIENQIRQQTNLKKSQLKTNELFKNLSEQEIDVITNNIEKNKK